MTWRSGNHYLVTRGQHFCGGAGGSGRTWRKNCGVVQTTKNPSTSRSGRSTMKNILSTKKLRTAFKSTAKHATKFAYRPMPTKRLLKKLHATSLPPDWKERL